MDCKGAQTRACIARKYKLAPVAHVKLLKGQEKRSCTGRKLTHRYYCFSFNSDEEEGTFFCGHSAADHFLELIEEKPLPLFNPLKSHSNSGSIRANSGNRSGREWTRCSKQLYDAINLLVICWDIVPGPILVDIKSKIETYHYDDPFTSRIRSINTIISKDREGRTLQEMLEDLRAENDLREFDFCELNMRLEEVGEISRFG